VFFAMATTYSTPAASSSSKSAGVAKPPSSRMRTRARGNGGGRVARAQHGGDQILAGFVVDREEGHQRQVTPAAVEAVEERQLLGAMRGVLRDVEVDRDPPRATLPPAMAGQHRVGQRLAHAVQRSRRHRVFEARHGRLRREPPAGDRIAVEQQLLDRIVRQPVGVIGIGIAARDPKDPLRQHVGPRVGHARRRPWVGQRRRQRRDHADRPLRRLEQNRAAIGAGVRLVEGGRQRLVEEIRKENSLWYRGVVQQRRLRVAKWPSASPLYHSEAFLFLLTHSDS
jgi:hypothetical protein